VNIAVIPARGGSQRLPRKNILPFAGKPMLAWAVQVARDSGLFDEVIVSTDDDEIAAVAKAHGASVPFRRPAELSDGQTTTVPVIAHAADWLAAQGVAPQSLCCIYPCVPLLQAEDLRAAHALFVERQAHYVYPVLAFHSSPWRAMRRGDDGAMAFIHPEHELTRTQDLPTCYSDAGQFYWGRTAAWQARLPMHSKGHGWVMPADRVVDIDTAEDWQRAEALYRALKRA
jgi:pseudaminic acid cytidylyltransferase